MSRNICLGITIAIWVVQLTGCAPVAFGALSATSASFSEERRTIGTVVDDTSIEWQIQDWINNSEGIGSSSNINVTSYNHIVLLSGEVGLSEEKRRVEKIASQHAKVRFIHNDLMVAIPSSFLSRSRDSLLTTRIKALLFGERDFLASRVKVVTEREIVYLMGLVTEEESEWATELTRKVNGVQRVVKLFEIIEYVPPPPSLPNEGSQDE